MIQKFNNFKNNSMSNRINESQDAEMGLSEYYDNKIKELQLQKKKSLDAFGVLRFKLETQFGYTIEYDGTGLIKIITGQPTLPIEIGKKVFDIIRVSGFTAYTVYGKTQSVVYSAGSFLSTFEYIVLKVDGFQF